MNAFPGDTVHHYHSFTAQALESIDFIHSASNMKEELSVYPREPTNAAID